MTTPSSAASFRTTAGPRPTPRLLQMTPNTRRQLALVQTGSSCLPSRGGAQRAQPACQARKHARPELRPASCRPPSAPRACWRWPRDPDDAAGRSTQLRRHGNTTGAGAGAIGPVDCSEDLATAADVAAGRRSRRHERRGPARLMPAGGLGPAGVWHTVTCARGHVAVPATAPAAAIVLQLHGPGG